MKKILLFITAVYLLAAQCSSAANRIALLPSFTDFDGPSSMRTSLAAFDARLQAELLKSWDAEILSRAGLSAAVFEQKLTISQTGSGGKFQLLPADILVISILDESKKQLRIFVNRVGANMTLGEPKVFAAGDATAVSSHLPTEVAAYIANIAKLPPRPILESVEHEQTDQPIVCSLLEPVTAGGFQSDVSKVSPLIRVVLENTVADEGINVSLVERNQVSKLVEEQTLAAANGFSPNQSSGIGRLIKADLILVPFIHFQNSQIISTDLFAIDVSTGRILACRSWTGSLLEAPPADHIKDLLRDASYASRKSAQHPAVDHPGLRHAEAKLIIGLKSGWDGLRQQIATTAELATRLADSAMALAHDDLAIVDQAAKTFFYAATVEAPYPLKTEFEPQENEYIQIAALRKSGQLDLLHQQAAKVFELPLTELAKSGGEEQIGRLANFWTRMGEPQKALALITTGRTKRELLASNAYTYQTVLALMNLERYQECIDFLATRKNRTHVSALAVIDAHRALGDFKNEFETMWEYRSVTCSYPDRIVRFLDLSIDQGKVKQTVEYVTKWSNAWAVNNRASRLAIIRARIAAGQRKIAISEAQSVFLSAKKDRDLETGKALLDNLDKLGAKPLERLPRPRDFIKIPTGFHIDLIHDQTLETNYVNEVAAHLAGFWGCPVYVKATELDCSKFSSYRKIAEAVEASNWVQTIARIRQTTERSLGTIFLTQTKLVSVQNNYRGDIYSLPLGSVTVVSDHYFRKFRQYDSRPLPQITAIAAASLSGARRYFIEAETSEDSNSWFSPPPPDLFATNGVLNVSSMELGISPRTGELLGKISATDLLQFIEKMHHADLAPLPPLSPADQSIADDLSGQLSQKQPTIILPQP